jgi:hypothetical protein
VRNGIILYLDQREPLRALPEASVGRLILAALDYAATGEEPAFTGEERLAWLFLRQAVDRDGERYEQRCEKARRAARSRWSAMQTHADDANSNSNSNSNSNPNNSNSNPNSNPNSNDNSNSNSNCVCERAREARVPPTQAAARDTHSFAGGYGIRPYGATNRRFRDIAERSRPFPTGANEVTGVYGSRDALPNTHTDIPERVRLRGTAGGRERAR